MDFLSLILCICTAILSVESAPLDQTILKFDAAPVDLAWFEPQPPGLPCYHKPGKFNDTECQDVRKTLRRDRWISSRLGAHFYGNWASCQATGETCALPLNDSTIDVPDSATCYNGSVPGKVLSLNNESIETRDAQIYEAFRMAEEEHVPLAIRNTGHDWKGRSSGPGTYVLWTHALKGMSYDWLFRPEGCESPFPTEEVFHYDAGVQWGDAYHFAEEHNRAILGGTCGSVGIAGWLQGGGHSPLTPSYGMGVDNIRQIEVIVPRGEGGRPQKLVVNECQHEDIFFALRGGGAGTYGIITQMTYKALEKSPVQVLNASITTGPLEDDKVKEWFNIVTSHAPTWKANGWGGYMKPGVKGSKTGGAYVQLSNPKSNIASAKEDMEEMTAFLKSNNFTCDTPSCEPKTYSSWFEFFQVNLEPWYVHQGGPSAVPGSQLIGPDAFEGSERKQFVDTLFELYEGGYNLLLMGVTPNAEVHTHTSALHPSWSDAILSVRINDFWDQYYDGNTPKTIRNKFYRVHNGTRELRRHAPDFGVSLSEANIWELDPSGVFWGSTNADRLVSIKEKYDPKNILTNWGAVNFNSEDERFRCYPLPPWIWEE